MGDRILFGALKTGVNSLARALCHSARGREHDTVYFYSRNDVIKSPDNH